MLLAHRYQIPLHAELKSRLEATMLLVVEAPALKHRFRYDLFHVVSEDQISAMRGNSEHI
jgi:hypothetical protein